MFASPLARKVAQEQGVDVAAVHGTGSNNRVIRADVLDYAGIDQQQQLCSLFSLRSCPSLPLPLLLPTPVFSGHHRLTTHNTHTHTHRSQGSGFRARRHLGAHARSRRPLHRHPQHTDPQGLPHSPPPFVLLLLFLFPFLMYSLTRPLALRVRAGHCRSSYRVEADRASLLPEHRVPHGQAPQVRPPPIPP